MCRCYKSPSAPNTIGVSYLSGSSRDIIATPSNVSWMLNKLRGHHLRSGDRADCPSTLCHAGLVAGWLWPGTQQFVHLPVICDLLFEQTGCQPVEFASLPGEQRRDGLVPTLDQSMNLLVDLRRPLLTRQVFPTQFVSQEAVLAALLIGDEPQLAHPP